MTQINKNQQFLSFSSLPQAPSLLSLTPSSPTKLINNPLNCLTIFIITTESSIRPIGPNKASGSRSTGDNVQMSIMRINFIRGFVSMNLMPSGLSNLGAYLMNELIQRIDLINYIELGVRLVIGNICSYIHLSYFLVIFLHYLQDQTS